MAWLEVESWVTIELKDKKSKLREDMRNELFEYLVAATVYLNQDCCLLRLLRCVTRVFFCRRCQEKLLLENIFLVVLLPLILLNRFW